MLIDTTPYSRLAPYYDKVMNHVDYKKWAEFIKTLFLHYDQKPKNIIELACGTGSIFEYLQSNKWSLFGGDRSLPMLVIGNAKKKEIPCSYFCADFCSSPIKNAYFDVALILYDSVNYIIKDTDIINMFNEINRILKNDGMFIFDVVSPYICNTAFRDYTEQEFWGKSGYTRKSWYIADKSMQFNDFEIYINNKIFKEHHQQKIRFMEEWEHFIKKSPLQLLAAYHNFSLRKARYKSERIHFVCRKVKSND
jgi:ubiquinone/menaquinone biosynthesis C-methylase UbiE